MELDIIHALTESDDAWLAPFPIVFGVEYYVHPAQKHLGRGDLILCDRDYMHFLVVELKRTRKNKAKLIQQMYFYRDHLKYKYIDCLVDCAAVAEGKLVQYVTDDRQTGEQMFFSRKFVDRLRSGKYKALRRPRVRSFPSSICGASCGRPLSVRA